MLMAAAALLEKKPKPTDADIDEAMTNICRCGTYQRVRAAIHRAAGTATTTASMTSGVTA
jgi:isoquinoline 1-oxidoreductase alpha subunit